MKTWRIEPKQTISKSCWVGFRNGDPPSLCFYGSRKFLETFLDDRCTCNLKTTCQFHKELKRKNVDTGTASE